MKRILILSTIFLILIVSTVPFLFKNDFSSEEKNKETVFVGITYCGDTIEGGKALIDKVKNYTNLFVLQSGTLQRDLEKVEELGDYAISSGLSFLPYFSTYLPHLISPWLETATCKWGNQFLGVYYGDEPGGRMLDDYVEFKDVQTDDTIMKTRYGDIVVHRLDGIIIHYELSGTIHLLKPESTNGSSSSEESITDNPESSSIYITCYSNGTIRVTQPDGQISTVDRIFGIPGFETYEDLLAARPFKDFDDAAQRFISHHQDRIENLKSKSIEIFTSDYALYWFDYVSGYDVVLSQLGWNHTLEQDVALVRGAARMQNKDWGVIITWKYNRPPYLDNGTEVYEQMCMAYECGAKYIVLFNYFEEGAGPYGTIEEEHFWALERFWNEAVKDSDVIQASIEPETVLILPNNYGWGMRWKEDKIWGVLKPDEKSLQIWNLLQNALTKHGLKLDIVYDDAEFPVTSQYQQIYSWNQTG